MTTPKNLQQNRAQVKAIIRTALRTVDYLVAHEEEVVAYLVKEFGLKPKVAAGSYQIVKKVLDRDGDIEDSLLKATIDQIRKERKTTREIRPEQLADLSILREVNAERKK